MAIEEISQWKTEDGAIHDTKEKALKHEAELPLKNWLADKVRLDNDRHRDMSAYTLLYHVFQDAQVFFDLLKNYIDKTQKV